MSPPAPRPSPEGLSRARALADRTLTPDEVAAHQAAPITDEERQEIRALVRWFRRRYPTPRERLAYVRRAYDRWRKGARP